MPSDFHLYQMAIAFYVPVKCFLRHKMMGLGRVPC